MLQTFRYLALMAVGVILAGVLLMIPFLHEHDGPSLIFFGATLLLVWLLVEAAYSAARHEHEAERGDHQ